jgi:lysophospholipase L1-like esterase
MVFSFLSAACKVWIVGDSYIRRGEERAKETIGTNLGVSAHIQWFGKGGMRWDDLLPFFHTCLKRRMAPDVLVIHCGGNDLGCVKSVLLLKAMKRDLHDLHQQFPQMKIMLSSINQRRQWRHAPPEKMDKVRKFVNNVMATFVSCVNGRTVPHPYIRFDKPELFLSDNVHLTAKGSDIFLNGIAQVLKDN